MNSAVAGSKTRSSATPLNGGPSKAISATKAVNGDKMSRFRITLKNLSFSSQSNLVVRSAMSPASSLYFAAASSSFRSSAIRASALAWANR